MILAYQYKLNPNDRQALTINQAAINIGKKGLELLGLSSSKLLGVTQEVTAKSKLTDLTNNSQEISTALAVEPSNPLQLNLFEWINGQVIGCSESPLL